MNAKKIMGAVLVALLAAALFVGAGSAAVTADADGQTVFYYQVLDTDIFGGTWNNAAGDSFTIATGADYVANTALPEGKYSYNDSVAIYLKKPTVTISLVANSGVDYIVANGGEVYEGSTLTFSVAPVNTIGATSYIVTGPDKVPIANVAESDIDDKITKKGEYTIQAVFTQGSEFATGTPSSALVSDVVFTLNVVKATAVKITADAETVLKNNVIAVTVTGKPGLQFDVVEGDDFIVASAPGVTTGTDGEYVMPNTGKATFYLKAVKEDAGSGKIKIVPYDANGKAEEAETFTVTITEGTITAKTDKESYFIGNKVVLSGTTTAGDDLFVYFAGTNIDFHQYKDTNGAIQPDVDAGAWELEIPGSYFQKYDAGTYTVYISTDGTAQKVDDLDTYTTALLVLKQPFISITDAPSVAVMNTDYKVTGTAEATSDVKFYIFGTNYFYQNTATVEKGVFEIEKKITGMDAGQYFMVVQHPMYDKVYNIQVVNDSTTDKNYPVYLYDSNGVQIGAPLFNVTDRQKTNAAQAFVDELAGQNIDDMYVKASFVVAAASSVINPIPSEITQGSKLTVSGQTNVGAGELVTVEMISTAFAAQPKETVGSASFIALTTKTNEDGSWEITFDTTGLNVDEYTITAAVSNLDKATAKVNVIEGAPTEQPTTEPTTAPTETQPTETTPTQTPGFGALAALAGLGAVAVLLLRRE